MGLQVYIVNRIGCSVIIAIASTVCALTLSDRVLECMLLHERGWAKMARRVEFEFVE